MKFLVFIDFAFWLCNYKKNRGQYNGASPVFAAIVLFSLFAKSCTFRVKS